MKTRGLRSFFSRLFYPMIALSIIPSLLITLLINLLYSRYQLEYFKNECTMTASQIADSIDGLLGDYEAIVSFVAENEAVELALQGDRGYDDDVREIISNCMFRMKGRMELHVLSFLGRAAVFLRHHSTPVPLQRPRQLEPIHFLQHPD